MQLSENWITEKTLDFEYKKYVLLAYLQNVDSDFSSTKIYPKLIELINHYKQLLSIKETRDKINSAKTDLLKIDLQNFKLVYNQNDEEDLMQYINELVQYSQPMFSHYINEGKKLYDFVEQQINIEPVGVVPVRINEGYLLAQDGKKAEIKAYEYQMSFFESDNEKYRTIRTNYIESYETSITTNYIKIKQQIIKTHKEMPNPAVFLLHSDLEFPLDETFLPVAKRLAVKYISI